MNDQRSTLQSVDWKSSGSNDYDAAIVQTVIRMTDPVGNIERAEHLVRTAVENGARLVVLPEAFSNGLPLPRLSQVAEEVPGPLSDRLRRLARSCGIHLVAGIVERAGADIFSTALLIEPSGNCYSYRRLFVYDLESHFLTCGERCDVIDTELGRIGLMLGYDVHFPEVARQLFLQGAEVIVCPALLLRPFANAVRQLALARATEDTCYFLLASAAGENTLAGLTFMGNSMIAQGAIGLKPFSNQFVPQRQVLSETGTDEAVITARIRIDLLRELQSASPLLDDFRRNSLARTHENRATKDGTVNHE